MQRKNADSFWSEGLLAGPRNKSDATRDLEKIATLLLKNHEYACHYNVFNELIINFKPYQSFNITQILKHEPDFEQLQIDPDLIQHYKRLVLPHLIQFFESKTPPTEKDYRDKDIKHQYQDLLYAEKLAITLYSTAYYKKINAFLRMAGENTLHTIKDEATLHYFFKQNTKEINSENVKDILLTTIVACHGLVKITPLKEGELYRKEGEITEVNDARDKNIESRNHYLAHLARQGSLPDEKMRLDVSPYQDQENIGENSAPILHPARQMAFFSTSKSKKIAKEDNFGDKNPIKTFVKIKDDSPLYYDIGNLQEYEEEERLLLPGSQLVYLGKSYDMEFKANVYEAVVSRALNSDITANYNSKAQRLRTELMDGFKEYDKATLIFWFNLINHDKTLAVLKQDSQFYQHLIKQIELKIIEEKSEAFLAAASYANKEHFTKPFKDANLCDDDVHLIIDNKTIEKPNHNINNAIRTALFILLVIPHYASYSKNLVFKKYCKKLLSNLDKIVDIQRGILFFTSGRESELNFRVNMEKVIEYKKNAANNFMEYVKLKKINSALVLPLKEMIQSHKENEIQRFHDTINKVSDIKYVPSLSELIFYISVEAHDYDLARCFEEDSFIDYVKDIFKYASEQSDEASASFIKNLKIAQEVIKATGDRLMTKVDENGKSIKAFEEYNMNIFYETSTNPLICFRLAMNVLYDYLQEDIKNLYVNKNSYVSKNLREYDNKFLENIILMLIKNRKIAELEIVLKSISEGLLPNTKNIFSNTNLVLLAIQMDNPEVLDLLLKYQILIDDRQQLFRDLLPTIIKYSAVKVFCYLHPDDKRNMNHLMMILNEIKKERPDLLSDPNFIAEIFLYFNESIESCSEMEKSKLFSFVPVRSISKYLVEKHTITRQTWTLIKKLGLPTDLPVLETLSNISDDLIRIDVLHSFNDKVFNTFFSEIQNIDIRNKYLRKNETLYAHILDKLLNNHATLDVSADMFSILLSIIYEFYLDSDLTKSIFNYQKTESLIKELPNLNFLISNLPYNKKNMHFLIQILSFIKEKKDIVVLLKLAITKLDINMLLAILESKNLSPSHIKTISGLEKYNESYLYNMFLAPESVIQLMKRDKDIDISNLTYDHQLNLLNYILKNNEIELFRNLTEMQDKDLVADIFLNSLFSLPQDDKRGEYDEYIAIAIKKFPDDLFYNLIHNVELNETFFSSHIELLYKKINNFMRTEDNIRQVMSEINKIKNEQNKIIMSLIFIFSGLMSNSPHPHLLIDKLIILVATLNKNWYGEFDFLDEFLINKIDLYSSETLQLLLNNISQISIQADLKKINARTTIILLSLLSRAENTNISSLLATVDKNLILIMGSAESKKFLWDIAFRPSSSPELLKSLLERNIFSDFELANLIKSLPFGKVYFNELPIWSKKFNILSSIIKDQTTLFNFIRDHFIVFLNYVDKKDDEDAWNIIISVLEKTQSFSEFPKDKNDIIRFFNEKLSVVMSKQRGSPSDSFSILAYLSTKHKNKESHKVGLFSATDKEALTDTERYLKRNSTLEVASFTELMKFHHITDTKIIMAAWNRLPAKKGAISPSFIHDVDKNELKSALIQPHPQLKKSLLTEDLANKIVEILWEWGKINLPPKPTL